MGQPASPNPPKTGPEQTLYVGLMSGTSRDGIDAALVRFGDRQCEILATRAARYPEALRAALDEAAIRPDNCTIDKLATLDHQVACQFADAAIALLRSTDVDVREVTALGSHGQTLRHRPNAKHPFTLQIGDPNIIASRTGITTVADFRRRDLAEGGEGAPLAPAFHEWMFGGDQSNSVVLNLGGIANITVLTTDTDAVVGFDTGPANTLLDAWIQEQRNKPFDEYGMWAATGSTSDALLAELVGDPYFQQAPPKSTGFEYFHLEWLRRRGTGLGKLPPEDVQATLSEFTAKTVAEAIRTHAPNAQTVLACGGGVHNDDLMERLRRALPGVSVATTACRGLDPDWVEAVAFAWLARQTMQGMPGNLPSVTGARRAVVLGGVYRA